MHSRSHVCSLSGATLSILVLFWWCRYGRRKAGESDSGSGDEDDEEAKKRKVRM
jgi:hypothetical protein